MPLNPGLATSAISALVGCPVITYEEYLRNPSPDIQALDMEAFHKSVLVAPPPQLLRRPSPPHQTQQPGSPQPGQLNQPHLPGPDSVTETPGTGAPAAEIPSSEAPSAGTPAYPTAEQVRWGLGLIPRIIGLISPSGQSITVFIKTLTGTTVTISVTLDDTINIVKHKIAEKVDLPPEEQRLVFGGKQLEDHLTVRDYGIQRESTIHLALRIRGGGPSAMYLPPGFLDPHFDFDFTRVKDGRRSFKRGGETYKRPCGWLRYALKVNGKFDSDVWLGSSNAPGEWPVSYHGTGRLNAESIAEVGYKLSKGVRFLYGSGVYSSPSVTIAEAYAREFSSHGKRYKVIIQNRVNPANLRKVPTVDYWISPGDEDIRAYGLCIKEV